jgi:hypothetical protein
LLAFDQADLNANRFGKFSTKQKKKLEKIDKGVNRFLLILSLLVLAGSCGAVISAVLSDDSWTKWILPVILLIIAIWLFSGTRNKVDQSILKAEGVVNFIVVQSQTGSVSDFDSDRFTVQSHQMHVGGVAFENADPTLIQHMQGDTYAVYYTSSTRQILSVELLSKRA